MATSTSNELVIEKADSATLILHPLVLINIADHVTRQRVFTKTPNPRVVGALLGQQRAKTIELLHSFELIYATAADGSISLDVEFFRERKGQYKQTFENYDVIGWYSTGLQVTATEVAIQRQLLSETDGEASAFLLVDTDAIETATRDLPVSAFEAEMKLNADQSNTLFFTKLPFRVDTGDSERVAVDHVAKARPASEDESPTVAHLARLQNAIRMLNLRISTVKKYLERVNSGEIKEIDYNLLRQIQNLVKMLPTMSTTEFREESLTEFNDSLLQTFLASVTKGSHDINELIDHYNTAYDRQARIGMRFGGIH